MYRIRTNGMITIMPGTIVGVHHRDILPHMGWGMGCPDLEVFFDRIVVRFPTEVHIGEDDLQTGLATFGSIRIMVVYTVLFNVSVVDVC